MDRYTLRSMDPGRAVERDPDRTLPHLVVSDVAPAVEDGRYAVKRLVGDGLRIGADIFTDGHDQLAARVLYLTPGERRPLSAPMTYSFEDDRWYATLSLDRAGEWRFAVEGWIDRFATWRGELAPIRCARPSRTPEATTTTAWPPSPRCWRTSPGNAAHGWARHCRRSCRR
jgi:hypothetical protein